MGRLEIVNVNAHLHTPYSFSAFDSIPQALDMAVAQGVKVVGINDFYTMKGYGEWSVECAKRRLYPLFNIEFIGLQESDQERGIRVNDPNNPGRTYLAGKGLMCPSSLGEPYASQLDRIVEESNNQVRAMCEKLNGLLEESTAGFSLHFENIEKVLTKGMVRERHLAKALRIAAYTHFKNDPDAIRAFFDKLFHGRALRSEVSDVAGVENEIRGNLLKAGGAAFVSEDPRAFLPVEDVIAIVRSAGGIPTYPFLGEDAKGAFTDFEEDLENAAAVLKERGIYSAEFITPRNGAAMMEKYAGYLWDHGFIVTFGSEHNTPVMEPVELFAAGGVELTGKLKEINYMGACVIAAHQDLVASGRQGYLDERGIADTVNRDRYIAHGDKVIKSTIR